MYPNRTQPGNFVRPHFPPPPRPLNQAMPMYFQSDEPAQQPGYVGFFAGSQQHQMPQNNHHFPPSTSSSNQDYSANYFDYGNDDQTEQNYEDYDGNYDFELDATFGYNGRGRREEKLANKKGTHYCDICNCECVGAESFQSHLDGKNHKKKEKSAQGFLQTTLKNKPAYHCEICNIDCSGADTYQTHISGKKHQNAIRILIKANKPIPSTEVSLVLPETNETDEEGGGSKKKGKKRKAAAKSSEEEYPNPNTIPLNSGLFKPEIINEKHIQEKINQIELNEEQNAAVEKLVQLVEETLYNVSNLIESNRNQQSTGDGNEASARLLRGVMRVGLLANQLLMKSDRRADLVILCSAIPTSDLLYQIVELFRRNINETQKNQNLGYENSINITEMFNESAFVISRTGIPISIFVTLTCSAMRQWSPGDLNYHPYHEPPNALPKIPSLHALAEMRRTKFYQVKCEPHPAMNWTVKIVRDFGNRVPAWSHLSNWMIILIVEKALSLSLSKNPESPVGPSGALKALFSAISDGLILGQNTPLPDPCEKLATDAIASLGGNERTKIFQSARYSLRQMNTNNLAKLLALEGTGVPSMEYSRPTADMPKKKRPNPNNTPGMGNMQNGPNNSSRFETWRPGRMTNTY